jgi:adenylate cyclase
MSEALDWAFCTPVPGEACAGWGLYVAGRSGDARVDLRPDMKFTELVADLLGAMRDYRFLQRQQASLGRFFSPVTLPILASAEGEKALEPRETEVTILFCDLRGFSREAERSRDDLMGLLNRVSRALDVMTKCIHGQNGVIGDFQGDAALAFWGWPLDLEDRGASAVQACRAAVEIRQRFAASAVSPSDPLSGFRCGIGIATGIAVAGRLGTAGQFKIDVFGPVVNLASRLEGITKQLRVPILVDENTVRAPLPAPRAAPTLRHGPPGHGERAPAAGRRARSPR